MLDKRMREILSVVYDKHVNHGWDTVWAVCGDEGVGKSNFGLWAIDEWYRLKNGVTQTSDIKHMCLDSEQFVEDLKDMKKFEATNFDEAGELTNRRVMSNYNVLITRAYAVIRGDNLFTILTHPDFFDLDPFFVKRRVRGLVYVYKREKSQCRYAFWSKTRLRTLVMLNAPRRVKSYWLVNPTHIGIFSLYNGVLRDAYLEKKTEKMAQVRKNLYDEVFALKGTKSHPEVEIIAKMSKHFGRDQVAEALGISEMTVYRREKAYATTENKS